MQEVPIIVILYILAINIYGFVLFGMDKKKAEKKEWRISEKKLLFVAIIGGSIGSYIGMEYFHHKTKHKKFTLGLPAILLLQGLLIYVYASNPI